MAFSTIQGSGGAPDSFVGTSGVDSLVLVNSDGNLIAGAQPAADIITITNSGAPLYGQVMSSATFKGGQGDDTIQRTGAALTISSMYLNGNSNADTITFLANDAIIASTIHGGQGADTIGTGALTSSLANGNKDNDQLNLNGAANSATAYGGQGNDTINTNALASSLVSGDNGSDQIISVNALITASTANGGEGNDTINFAASATANSTGLVINGDAGDDTLTGAAFATVINGGAGIDGITGGAGNDTITGGAAADQISLAGGGIDRVVYDAIADFGDVITGAAGGAGGDVVSLSNAAIRATGSGFVAGNAAAINTTTTGFYNVTADVATATATMTAAQVQAAAFTGFANTTAGATGYVALSTDVNNAAVDSYIYKFTVNGLNNGLSSVERVATLAAFQLDTLAQNNFILA